MNRFERLLIWLEVDVNFTLIFGILVGGITGFFVGMTYGVMCL